MTALPMRQQVAQTIGARFDEDPALALVLAEISADLFAIPLRRYPARAVNLGIMEQTMVGVAAGFALEGFFPVVHTIAPFVAERSLEQLKLDFGYQRLAGLFVTVGASYDYAESGATHFAPGDVAAVASVPGMRVVVPGTGDEAGTLAHGALDERTLTYLRTSTAENDESRTLTAGGLQLVRRGGGSSTVIAVGPLLDRVLAATAGLDVSVLYATTVAPLHAATLRAVAGEDVIVVEPFHAGTLAAQVTEALAGRRVRLTSIGVGHEIVHRYGTPADHDRAHGLDEGGLRERIGRALAEARRAA